MPRPRLTEQQREKRYRIYESAGSDAEAAQALGISRTAFTLWRNREGLKAKGRGGRKPGKAARGAARGTARVGRGKLRCPKCGYHVLDIEL